LGSHAPVADVRRIEDLDINQDLKFERRSWRVRQVASIVFAALLVAALLGVFGSGLVSDATRESDAKSFAVEYDRFLRFGAPATVHVELRSGGSETNVSLSRSYLSQFDVRGIKPQPESVTALPDRLVFTFKYEAPSRVDFNLLPRHAGRQRGTVTVDGEDSASFSQWVYP
jgi:hypothetical protein